MMKKKYNDIHFVFHTTNEHRQKLKNQVMKEDLKDCDVITDEKIKSYILYLKNEQLLLFLLL